MVRLKGRGGRFAVEKTVFQFLMVRLKVKLAKLQVYEPQ